MTDYTISPPASEILARAAPPLFSLLDRTGDGDALILGGGTALAARWGNHRRSTDVDLCLPRDVFDRHADKIPELLTANFIDAVRFIPAVNPGINGRFREGEFSIATAPPLLPDIIPSENDADRDALWGIRLEPTAEVLAKKLFFRMGARRKFVSRDLYDILTAAEEDPDALQRALSTLDPAIRHSLVETVSRLGAEAAKLGRALTDVHRPEWLNDLGNRASQLIAEGAGPTPVMPEPQPRFKPEPPKTNDNDDLLDWQKTPTPFD
ncbi:MAG: nucleotidyl transferase AbiEii/AbiGii toxin family protein [Rhodobacteraceae bacterium]|nr:nucleotidyl transferase AbiEii/AbiGii toxin family protein [Paracoccaceae bacterium]